MITIFLPFLFLGTVVIAAVCIGVGGLFRPREIKTDKRLARGHVRSIYSSDLPNLRRPVGSSLTHSTQVTSVTTLAGTPLSEPEQTEHYPLALPSNTGAELRNEGASTCNQPLVPGSGLTNQISSRRAPRRYRERLF
jgi:hypothetical protein